MKRVEEEAMRIAWLARTDAGLEAIRGEFELIADAACRVVLEGGGEDAMVVYEYASDLAASDPGDLAEAIEEDPRPTARVIMLAHEMGRTY